MIKTYKKFFLIISLILFTMSCGFKVLDKSSLFNLRISEIQTQGDKKTNFLIKNNLQKTLNIEKEGDNYMVLNTTKRKEIKEKNSRNQITKYQITISSTLSLNSLKTNEKKTFSTEVNGSYDVSNNHSTTITNQNNLEKNLAKRTSDLLTKQLIFIFNAN
tara:strand:- start:2630 stop:3109 length:480 start_codon:yes stop_codon:yes gene_type:complete